MQKILFGALILLVIGAAGAFFLMNQTPPSGQVNNASNNASSSDSAVPDQAGVPLATSTVLGTSVEGRAITAYHYGTGAKEILFVGGIHGGYEWNTVLLAFEAMDYLAANPTAIPDGVRVTVVPVMNPDGLHKIVGTDGRFNAADVKKTLAQTVPGRFNKNNVDLGRNFDCEWKSVSKWQSNDVSGGTAAFSESESLAIKSYVESHAIATAIVWYSAAGGVFSSSCSGEVSAATKALTQTYARASGYPAHESFDFYEISGDIVNWFAKQNIPAISVLLTNHTDPEWTKNRAGVDAVLSAYAE